MASDTSQLDVVATPVPDAASSLYPSDFYAWTAQQAVLLRAGDFDLAGLQNIIEEIETLGRLERAALRSAYRLVALHLLRLIAQRERASRSWFVTIARERCNAANCLEDNPSLKPQRDALFADAYRAARKEAQAETGLPMSAFSTDPPFSLAQLEDEDFLPNVGGDRRTFGSEDQR